METHSDEIACCTLENWALVSLADTKMVPPGHPVSGDAVMDF